MRLYWKWCLLGAAGANIRLQAVYRSLLVNVCYLTINYHIQRCYATDICECARHGKQYGQSCVDICLSDVIDNGNLRVGLFSILKTDAWTNAAGVGMQWTRELLVIMLSQRKVYYVTPRRNKVIVVPSKRYLCLGVPIKYHKSYFRVHIVVVKGKVRPKTCHACVEGE